MRFQKEEHKGKSGKHSAAQNASGVRRLRMCVVVTVDITLLNLCRGRFEYLSKRGFDIAVVCAPTPHAGEIESRGVRLFTVPLNRAVTPLSDLRAIWKLFRFLRRERFDLVEVGTPKGALVGSIAARLARVPSIVHLLRGLAYEGQTGLKRWMLKIAQTLPCRLADEVISVSHSMMEKAIQDHVCPANKIRVLGRGSSNGIDLNRFAPRDSDDRLHLRRSFDLPSDAVVAGFVGRMTKDKGIVELIRAFTEVGADRSHLYLLLVGDYEARDRPDEDVIETIAHHPRIRHVGWQNDTTLCYGVMDFLVLPTYREGFPTVLLEAAAMRLPAVTTDVTGCRDAVEAGETALVVPARNARALAQAIGRLADDKSLRERLGAAGRRRAEAFFEQERVWSLQEDAFRRLVVEPDGADVEVVAPTR